MRSTLVHHSSQVPNTAKSPLLLLALVFLFMCAADTSARGTAEAGGNAVDAPSSPPPTVVRTRIPKEMTVDSMNREWAPYALDCNWNGVPDSADIADGMEDDVNHNGIIDACDPDTSLCIRHNRNDCLDSWKTLKAHADTSYFWTTHAPNGTVLIRYTVPPGSSQVTIDALPASTGKRIRIAAMTRSSDAYEFNWDKRDPATNELLSPGLYILRLRVGSHAYTRRVRWEEVSP